MYEFSIWKNLKTLVTQKKTGTFSTIALNKYKGYYVQVIVGYKYPEEIFRINIRTDNKDHLLLEAYKCSKIEECIHWLNVIGVQLSPAHIY